MRIAVNIRRFMAERRRLIDLVAEQHADLARLRAALERLRGRSFLGLTPTHGTASAVISRRDLYGLMASGVCPNRLEKSIARFYLFAEEAMEDVSWIVVERGRLYHQARMNQPQGNRNAPGAERSLGKAGGGIG